MPVPAQTLVVGAELASAPVRKRRQDLWPAAVAGGDELRPYHKGLRLRRASVDGGQGARELAVGAPELGELVGVELVGGEGAGGVAGEDEDPLRQQVLAHRLAGAQALDRSRHVE